MPVEAPTLLLYPNTPIVKADTPPPRSPIIDSEADVDFLEEDGSDTAEGVNNFLKSLTSPPFGDGSDTAQFVDNLISLRRRFANSPEDRVLPFTEIQRPQYEPVTLAPDLTVNTDLLKAKFDVQKEMMRFCNDINTVLKEGKPLAEAVSKSAGELEMNIRTHDAEIIKSKVVLFNPSRFGQKNGSLRMVGNNGEPVVDAITPQERKGAVLEASKTIEDFLLVAPNNSFAVLMSPDGWNGFVGEYGQELSHLNTQVLVFWKDQNGNLKNLTFHIDLKQEKAKEVMLSLGVSEEVLQGETEKDRIANIVRNPALLSLPRAYANAFEYVFDKILAERGNGDIRLLQLDGKEVVTPVEEVRRDIKRFDSLLKGTENEEKHIAQLINFILENSNKVGDSSIQQQIVTKIERTILQLAREYLRDTNQTLLYRLLVQPEVKAKTSEVPLINEDDDNFGAEIAFLKTKAGCPPGSSNLRLLRGISLGSELVNVTMPSTVTIEDLKDPDFCIRCGACGEFIWKIVRKGGKCPKCPAIRECG